MFTFWTGLIVGVLLGTGLCIGAFVVLMARVAADMDRQLAQD